MRMSFRCIETRVGEQSLQFTRIVERKHRMNEDGRLLTHVARDLTVQNVEERIRHRRVDVHTPTWCEDSSHLAKRRRLVAHELKPELAKDDIERAIRQRR